MPRKKNAINGKTKDKESSMDKTKYILGTTRLKENRFSDESKLDVSDVFNSIQNKNIPQKLLTVKFNKSVTVCRNMSCKGLSTLEQMNS